ncbi:uncharacterized protein LOC124145172 [Haliotis rufescens]|uniref:uncharacterized protein LOC124145172 n=1 Tax=Haliotis rufescens TaxID=6454 RepID=UPI00201F426B|nr:uncharacterized protein LOC124145172 [Haliotis rufescens]
MKIALVFLLLVAVLVIQDADSWRRRRWRFRFRAPRIRIRKIFRPVKKIIKKIRPVLKKVVKPILKKFKAIVKPLLKPLQAKVCATLQPIQCLTGRDISWQTEHVDNSPAKREAVEGRGAETDLEDDQSDVMVRRAREMEDWLETYDKEGQVLQGLNDLVNTKRDVRELHQVLQDPARSKRLLKYVSKALCGQTGGRQEGEEGQDQEVDQEVTVPHTVIEYVTAAPASSG